MAMSSMLETDASVSSPSNQLGNSVYSNSLRHPPTCTTDCCCFRFDFINSAPAPLQSPRQPSSHRARSSSSSMSITSSSGCCSSHHTIMAQKSAIRLPRSIGASSSCRSASFMGSEFEAAAAGIRSPCPRLCCSSAEDSDIVSTEEAAAGESSFEGSINYSNNSSPYNNAAAHDHHKSRKSLTKIGAAHYCRKLELRQHTTCDDDHSDHYWIPYTSGDEEDGHPTRILSDTAAVNNKTKPGMDHSISPPVEYCRSAEKTPQHSRPSRSPVCTIGYQKCRPCCKKSCRHNEAMACSQNDPTSPPLSPFLDGNDLQQYCIDSSDAVTSSKNGKATTIARSGDGDLDDYRRSAPPWAVHRRAAEAAGQYRCDSILLPHEQQSQLEMAATHSSSSSNNSSSSSSRINSCSSCRTCMNSNATQPDCVAPAMNHPRHSNYDYNYTNEFRETADHASCRNSSIFGIPTADHLGAEHDRLQVGDKTPPPKGTLSTPSHRTMSVRSRSRAATDVQIASFSATPDSTVSAAAADCRGGRSTTRHCRAASAAAAVVDCVGDEVYDNLTEPWLNSADWMAMEADAAESPARFRPHHKHLAMGGCRYGEGQSRLTRLQPHHARNESDSFIQEMNLNHRRRQLQEEEEEQQQRGAEWSATPIMMQHVQQQYSGVELLPSSSCRSAAAARNYEHGGAETGHGGGAAAGYELNGGAKHIKMERNPCSNSGHELFRSGNGRRFKCNSRRRYDSNNYAPFPGRGAPPDVLCQACHSPSPPADLVQKLRCHACTKISRFRFLPPPPPPRYHHVHHFVPTSSTTSYIRRRSNMSTDESHPSLSFLPSLHPIVSANASSPPPSNSAIPTNVNLSRSSTAADLVDAAASESHFQHHETLIMERSRWNQLLSRDLENSASVGSDISTRHHLVAENEESGTSRQCTSVDDALLEDMGDGHRRIHDCETCDVLPEKNNIHNSGLMSVDACSSFSPIAFPSYDDDDDDNDDRNHADRFADPTSVLYLEGGVSEQTKCCSIYNNIIFRTESDQSMQNSSDDSRRSTGKDAVTMAISATTAHPAGESNGCNCNYQYMCRPSGDEGGAGNAIQNIYSSRSTSPAGVSPSWSTPVAQHFLFHDSSQSHDDDGHRFHQEEPLDRENGFCFGDSIGADSKVLMYTSSSSSSLLQWKQQQQRHKPGQGSALQEHLAYISREASRATHDPSEPNFDIDDWKASYVSDRKDAAAAAATADVEAAAGARWVGREDEDMGARRRTSRFGIGIGAGFLRRSFKELGRRSFKSMAIAMNLKEDEEEEEEEQRPRDVVVVNGQIIPETILHRVEGEAGPVHPGYYWYDYHAGFWGVAGGPCLGILPPFIEEFKFPLTRDCAGGDTGILVNGRELHRKDLSVLMRRGFPDTPDMSYAMDISGHVVDTTSGKLVRDLGKLAPSMERRGRGYGMFHPNLQSKSS